MAHPAQPWREEIDRLDGRITHVHDTVQTHLPRSASLEYKCASMTAQNESHATKLARDKQRLDIADEPGFLAEQKAVANAVAQPETRLDRELQRRRMHDKQRSADKPALLSASHRGPGVVAPPAPAKADSPMMFDFDEIEHEEAVTADLAEHTPLWQEEPAPLPAQSAPAPPARPPSWGDPSHKQKTQQTNGHTKDEQNHKDDVKNEHNNKG